MKKTFSRTTSISKRLTATTAVFFLLALGLAIGLLVHQWRAYASADSAAQSFERFRAGLVAMEKVSAERGPTNSALGAGPDTAEAMRRPLTLARAESDRRIALLLALLDKPECAHCEAGRQTVQDVRAQLTVARREVDRMIALPKVQRDREAILNAVGKMVEVIPHFWPLANANATTVARGDPDALNCVLVARLTADLREQAGLLGSVFTAALSANRPLSEAELFAIERVRGRIDALRGLIDTRVDRSALGGPAFQNLRTQYYGAGMGYIEGVREAAKGPGGANVTPAQLAATYVPMMRPITTFRDLVLDLAADEVRQHLNRALAALVITAIAALLVLYALLIAATLFRRGFVHPFIEATEIITSIADGKLATPVPQRGYRHEIKGLFHAINVLKENSIVRMQLERERDGLIRELEVMADTDFLTRLLNRRAFQRKAREVLSNARRDAGKPALIMFDADRFKQINDTFGHAAGDHALQMVANVCNEIWRPSDIVARIGGEEFAVLTYVDHAQDAIDAAERFRRRVESMVMSVEGTRFTMTLSFGIAVANENEPASLDALLLRADKLLYLAKLAGRNRVVSDAETSGRTV
jgi:diguanylate cyclase (GGDEF)-like protein